MRGVISTSHYKYIFIFFTDQREGKNFLKLFLLTQEEHVKLGSHVKRTSDPYMGTASRAGPIRANLNYLLTH